MGPKGSSARLAVRNSIVALGIAAFAPAASASGDDRVRAALEYCRKQGLTCEINFSTVRVVFPLPPTAPVVAQNIGVDASWPLESGGDATPAVHEIKPGRRSTSDVVLFLCGGFGVVVLGVILVQRRKTGPWPVDQTSVVVEYPANLAKEAHELELALLRKGQLVRFVRYTQRDLSATPSRDAGAAIVLASDESALRAAAEASEGTKSSIFLWYGNGPAPVLGAGRVCIPIGNAEAVSAVLGLTNALTTRPYRQVPLEILDGLDQRVLAREVIGAPPFDPERPPIVAFELGMGRQVMVELHRDNHADHSLRRGLESIEEQFDSVNERRKWHGLRKDGALSPEHELKLGELLERQAQLSAERRRFLEQMLVRLWMEVSDVQIRSNHRRHTVVRWRRMRRAGSQSRGGRRRDPKDAGLGRRGPRNGSRPMGDHDLNRRFAKPTRDPRLRRTDFAATARGR